MKRIYAALAAIASLVPIAMIAQTEERLTDAQVQYFETRIRPVLAQQCFICHTNTKSGGLMLDSREALLKGGKSGPAIVPGEPEKSLLISAIMHSGPLQMPKSAEKLTEAQIADFTQWVKEGAFWPVATDLKMKIDDRRKQFWSYKPLNVTEPPAVMDTSWPANPIDNFVLAKLEKEGLTPSPQADRYTLIRRATYDLTGLPPTYEEVQEFLADESPNAFEKVVDRLLASPRYGETWARHWMDVVRYGEDDYRVGQKPDRVERYPYAYLYRDWLINSFNDDMPYDTFVKAQLAADLMDESVRDKMIPALGMHGTGVWSFQDNPAPIERADEWNDKVDVTTKAFLGMTVGCARCHNHKYDPIPTKDFYSLASVFASSKYQPYPRVPEEVSKKYDAAKEELEKKEKEQKEFLEKASELYAQTLLMQTPDYMMAAWKVGKEKRTTPQKVADEARLDAEILERWVKFLRKPPNNYPYLTDWQAMVAKGGTEEQAKKLANEFYKKIVSVDRERTKLAEENEAALASLKVEGEEELYDPLPNGLKRRLNKHQIELKSLSREDTYLWQDVFQSDLPAILADNFVDDDKAPGLFKLTDWALEKRLPAPLADHITRMKEDIKTFKKEMGEVPPFVYGIAEAEPVDLKVFVRGNVYTFGEEAPRAFLTVFSDGEPTKFTEGSGRMELAENILQQPIAARVVVNRIWRWHMGSGFVETPNNFGLIGDTPSNPELLDYLADQFQKNGMSWKKMHKMILLSKTYQLSTAPSEASLAKDPGNRLYWRANRRRMDAEGVWDALRTASDTLDTSGIGGPSEQIGTDKMKRRGVYANTSRMYPNEFLATFDVPAATISSDRRYTTNVPQQRLFFLNSDFVRTQAELLAKRIEPAGDLTAQIQKAYEIVYQRKATDSEVRFVSDFMQQAQEEYDAMIAAEEAEAAAEPAETETAEVAEADTAEADTAERAAVGSMPASEMQKTAAADSEETETAEVKKLTPLESLSWALLSSNEFLYLN